MAGDCIAAAEPELLGYFLRRWRRGMVVLPVLDEIENLLLATRQGCHSVFLHTIPNSARVKRELFTKTKRLDFPCPRCWR